MERRGERRRSGERWVIRGDVPVRIYDWTYHYFQT